MSKPQIDAVGHIETRGVDYIPLNERHASPMNIFWILIGANLTFGLIVIGWLPISFGLSFWPAVAAIVVGNALGSLLLAPIALVGPRSGTNGPVSSGAYFGVVGRIIGSGVGVCICLGFYALAVWTGGQAGVAGLHRLFGLPNNNVTLGVTYAIIAVISSVTAIYGHANMVLVERLMIPIAGILMLIGFLVYGPHFSASITSGPYLLGAFWPTWVLCVTIAAVAAYGYAPLCSDWTRYISPVKHNSKSIALTTWVGCFVGLTVPFVFGAFTAVAVASTKLDYISGLVAVSPSWYLLPLIIIGIIGSFGQAVVCLYSSGLDFSSIFPSLTRPQATIVLSVVAIILVYVGTMVASAQDSVTAFLQVLGVTIAAWISIVGIGHFHRKGYYDVDALQVFNRRETGGAYWYTGGWNFRALIAWVAASFVGLMALQCSFYTGPWSNFADGVDLSWISALIIAGVVYYALIKIFPEHEGVHAAPGQPEAPELQDAIVSSS
jgi:purine-cytosine permease-like protein